MQRWRMTQSPGDNKAQRGSVLTLVSFRVGWGRAHPSMEVWKFGVDCTGASLSSVNLSRDRLKGAKCLNFFWSPDKYANSQFLLGNTDIVWQRGKPQPCFTAEQGIVKKKKSKPTKTCSILTKRAKKKCLQELQCYPLNEDKERGKEK